MARADALYPVPAAADLLAGHHVVQDHQRDPRGFSPWPQVWTTASYRTIFTDPTWYTGYINSISYVTINTVISGHRRAAAAYAFSRYRFVGDKHLFFWLFTNRMAPAAVFALPFLQLYYAIGLFDTHLGVALAHCLFNIPLAVWILEGFMSGVPKELDETAYVDGYAFRASSSRSSSPPSRRHRRRRLLLLHVLLGRAAARQDPDLGRGQADRRDDDAGPRALRLRARPARRGGR
jgi:ABC-type Fe3+ transport system permease subunit